VRKLRGPHFSHVAVTEQLAECQHRRRTDQDLKKLAPDAGGERSILTIRNSGDGRLRDG